MNNTPPTPAPVLELSQATAGSRLDASVVLAAGVDWTVRQGEFWVVAGEQHAGKTDLLMLAAGLLPPVAGTCRLFGLETHMLNESRLTDRLRTGLVFEDGQLLPELTLLQNVALPLQYHGNRKAEEVIRELEPLLDRMELSPLAGRRPANLSRNWRKRVGLARALTLQPELLLLDNPFHGMGESHRQWWRRFLDEIARERHLTIVLATDDLRPWAGDERRRFALLHERRFTVAGDWNELSARHPGIVRTLQAGPDHENPN